MSEKSDVATLPAQSWMQLAIHRPFRRGLGDVRVENHVVVEYDLNVRSAHDDLLCIPFSNGLEEFPFRGHDTIDRAVILPGLQVGVLWIGVVEHLDFNSGKRSIPRIWRANGDAVVRSGGELDLKLEMKVRVLLGGEKVAATRKAGDRTAIDRISLDVANPAIESLPVEERNETDFGCHGR